MKRYFTYKDDSTDKFWSIEVNQATITIAYGKSHTLGVSHTKTMENEAEATKEASKMVREKVRHGYRETVEKATTPFGQADFWSLIERSKNNSDDLENQVELLTEYLSQRSVEDIFEFKRIIDQLYIKSYQSPLWGAANLINGEVTEDGFSHFRGWLISRGREVFQSTLENPDNLAKYVREEDYNFGEYESEEMWYVAAQAFIAKTGETEEDFNDKITAIVYPEMEQAWDIEDDEELKKHFPKLYKKFGE